MKKIWKYEVHIGNPVFRAPSSATVLAVKCLSCSILTIWVLVDPESTETEHTLPVFGTGHEMTANTRHVDTVQDSRFIWHVFDIVLVAESTEDRMRREPRTNVSTMDRMKKK